MVSASSSSSSSKAMSLISWPFFVIFMVLPYLLGFYWSNTHLDQAHGFLERLSGLFNPPLSPSSFLLHEQPPAQRHTTSKSQKSAKAGDEVLEACYQKILQHMWDGVPSSQRRDDEQPWQNLSVLVHRNGESSPCGHIPDFLNAVQQTLTALGSCPDRIQDKYVFESFLTRVMYTVFLDHESCTSLETDREVTDGFLGFCDAGEEKTPLLQDHTQLVRIPLPVPHQLGENHHHWLPCHFHHAWGVRVTSWTQLTQAARQPPHTQLLPNSSIQQEEEEEERATSATTTTCEVQAADGTCAASPSPTTLVRELHLYAVPAGRVFMFAPNQVGEIIPLPHVKGGDPSLPVYMRVLSLQPRVLDIFNFFTKAESAALVERAMREQRESHRIKRSSTGASGYQVNNHRTSESGYDTEGPTSMLIKRRCFDVLGFDEYWEAHADGLQILRYNLTTAYIPHMDWIDGSDQLPHDYESAGKGGNRYATILLYMSDLEENDGGETVFPEAWPMGQAEEDHVDLDKALELFRATPEAAMLERGSWEETMTAKCRSRFAVRPNSARAVLFYSQLPNGTPDPASLHGACPIFRGTKYAANLWVWNTARDGYEGNPKNPRYKRPDGERDPNEPVVAQFKNRGTDPNAKEATLYFEDRFWGKLGEHDPPIMVNTFPGNEWNVRVGDTVIKKWMIDGKKDKEFFYI